MKMQLCAAQLLNCGVLMRIEPTGHWTWITSGGS